jgi:ParB-like chromosome segregation protein Spo0J
MAEGMPGDRAQIEHCDIADLIPYARNARTHSDAQVAQIAASIREFGFTNPVLIDGDGGIIAGHGRVLAARKLKLAAVPCVRLAHLTPAQKKAYIIADNKLALNAGWDDGMLGLEIVDLSADGFDVGLLGFDEADIAAMMSSQDMFERDSSAKEIDPDEYDMGHKCPRCGFEFDAKT